MAKTWTPELIRHFKAGCSLESVNLDGCCGVAEIHGFYDGSLDAFPPLIPSLRDFVRKKIQAEIDYRSQEGLMLVTLTKDQQKLFDRPLKALGFRKKNTFLNLKTQNDIALYTLVTHKRTRLRSDQPRRFA